MNTHAHAHCNRHANDDLYKNQTKKLITCKKNQPIVNLNTLKLIKIENTSENIFACLSVHTPVIINPTINKLVYAANSVLLVSPTKELIHNN